jgi:hypothetical protein
LQQHVTLPPPELSEALTAQEPRLAEILRMLLAKEPENRFQTAKELATAIEEATSQPAPASGVQPASSPQRFEAIMQRARGLVSGLGRRAPTSLSKIASSTSEVASSGVSGARRYLERWQRARRRRALARAADRQVTRTIVAAQDVGRQTMKSWRRLAASTRVTCAKGIEYCRTEWRKHGRRWRIAVSCSAALMLVMLTALVAWSFQGVRHPESAPQSDRADGMRPAHQPTKSSSSKRR